MKPIFLLSALLLLSCNREERPQAPTAAEAERLNDAEAMLNAMEKEQQPTGEQSGQPINR